MKRDEITKKLADLSEKMKELKKQKEPLLKMLEEIESNEKGDNRKAYKAKVADWLKKCSDKSKLSKIWADYCEANGSLCASEREGGYSAKELRGMEKEVEKQIEAVKGLFADADIARTAEKAMSDFFYELYERQMYSRGYKPKPYLTFMMECWGITGSLVKEAERATKRMNREFNIKDCVFSLETVKVQK